MIESEIKKWDVFICHATEDKREFVAALAKTLSAFDVNVWYDEYELKIGDSLSKTIDTGLRKSSYGLVVLSKAFMSKRWAEYELRGLTSREMLGVKVILPIWHGVDFQDVLNFSPPLADKLAIKSDSKTPLQVACEIIKFVRPDIFTRIQRRLAYRLMLDSAEVKLADPKALLQGPIQHAELPEELIGRIRLIRACLFDVYPISFDLWLDGFKRDSHPSREIFSWEHISAVYYEYLSFSPKSLSLKQRKIVFNLVLTLSVGLPMTEIIRRLPQGAAEQIIEIFKSKVPICGSGKESTSLIADTASAPITKSGQRDLEHFPNDVPENLIQRLLSKNGL